MASEYVSIQRPRTSDHDRTGLFLLDAVPEQEACIRFSLF
jgi:hypothetical protein